MELGEFTEGAEISQDGVRIAEALDHPLSLVFAYRGVGLLRLRQGEPQQAIPGLERSRLLCQSVNLALSFAWVASELGYAYALSGRVVEALPALEQAVERADAIGFMSDQSLRVSWLSETYLLAGRIDEGRQQADRAFDLSRNHKERGNQAWTLRLLGEIASQRDPPEVEIAEAHYRQALALATELGMRPLVAQCHLGLGKLYRRTGGRAKAEEHLTTAMTLYREMAMGFWLQKAEAELGALR